jgi:hypothetical protein
VIRSFVAECWVLKVGCVYVVRCGVVWCSAVRREIQLYVVLEGFVRLR